MKEVFVYSLRKEICFGNKLYPFFHANDAQKHKVNFLYIVFSFLKTAGKDLSYINRDDTIIQMWYVKIYTIDYILLLFLNRNICTFQGHKSIYQVVF